MTIKKITSLFVTISAFMWLMPLGAFIKPGQEKIACGGARAFHMCSMCISKGTFSGSVKPGISQSQGFGENAKSQAGGGTNFLPEQAVRSLLEKNEKFYETNAAFSFPLISSSIFHPPKALLVI